MSQGTGVRERVEQVEQVHGPSRNGAPPTGPAASYDLLKDKLFRAILLLTLVFLCIVMSFALIFDALNRRQPATGAAAAPSTASAVRHGMAAPNGNIVDVNLTSVEVDQTIVPAGPGVTPVTYHVWTFDGTAPGPVIRVHLGDTVHFTLHNASTIGMQHSIDFHAAMTPWADLPSGSGPLTGNYQPVNPGETKTFDWVAMYPGVFMYHCGVPPVLEHIANGMYGAIVVQPDNLPREREYVLVNSELYPGAKTIDGVSYGDPTAMQAAAPKYVVWNGVADQYKTSPLVARPNEKFRIWVVNVGPTLTSAWHVIGTMFDSYADGNPANVVYGDQTYNIPPGGAAMFELQVPEAGLYPFVTHAFAFTGRGAVGLIKIAPNAPAAPASYPVMGDPFSAGVEPFAPPASVADVVGIAGNPTPSPSSTPAATPTAAGTGTAASCSPKGTVVTVMAQRTAFSAACLAAPAKKAFTIEFMNMDPGILHNISIYTDSSASPALFTGELVNGPADATYHVPALAPGTYFFRCDVHPTQMFGTFVVR
jgi:nitrite reductase (NO-forming)